MTPARGFDGLTRATPDEPMFRNEQAFQARIVAIIALDPRGLAYHTHDSRRSQAGFPDLVIVGPTGVLFRELKMARENAAVWRPAHLADGSILRELRAIGLTRLGIG